MTAAAVVFAAVAAIFAFDYLTVKARDHRDRQNFTHTEADIDQAFRDGMIAGRAIEQLSRDTAEHEAVPRGTQLHPVPRGVKPIGRKLRVLPDPPDTA